MQQLMQEVPMDLKKVNKLQAELDATKSQVELLVNGPPPIRYSAVGRMRQKLEGMGEPKPAGDAAPGFEFPQAENILPPVGGLVKVAALLAVVGAAGVALFSG